MTEPTPWIREGSFIYQLTEDDRGRPVNLWSVSVQGGGPFAASEAEREEIARLIAKARHLPELVEALRDLDNCLVFAVPVTEAGVMITGQDAIDLQAAMTKAAAALALVQETGQ